MKKYLTGEKLVNLFLLALSVFYLSYSVTHYKIGTMRVPKEGFLPLLLGIGMVCLSGFLFIQSLAGKGDAKNVQLKLPWLRFAGMIAASFAYAMLLNTLGYCICTFLFLLAVLKLAKLEAAADHRPGVCSGVLSAVQGCPGRDAARRHPGLLRGEACLNDGNDYPFASGLCAMLYA